MYSPPVTEPDIKNEHLPGLPTGPVPETIKPETELQDQLICKQEVKQESDLLAPKKLKKSLLIDYCKPTQNVHKPPMENINHNILQKQVKNI